jgi:acetylornithine deacetylase/succinyl-diaminopimelate desuccinylase-like protein
LAAEGTVFPEPLRRIHDRITREFESSLAETRKYLRQPGLSYTGQGMKESAEMTLEYVRQVCPDAQLIFPKWDLREISAKGETITEKDGYPIIYGRLNSKQPNAKTLLFYYLYDYIQVEDLEDWVRPPFDATIIDAEEISLPKELGKIILSRGSWNSRGPGIGFLLALKAMLKETGDVPVNIIFCIEGEEEVGSMSLMKLLREHPEKFGDADALYIADMTQGMHVENSSGNLVVERGVKGILMAELVAEGGEMGGTLDGRRLWAGHSMLLDSPLPRLVAALSSMADRDGKILIDDFFENYRKPTPEVRAELDKASETFDEEGNKKALYAGRFKNGAKGKDLVADFLAAPMFNIDGITSGHTGPMVNTILPMRAVAKFDVRVVPDLTTEEVIWKIRKHLDNHGFPDIKLRVYGNYDWCRVPLDTDIMKAGLGAAKKHGVGYVSWPNSPGSLPSALFNLPSCSTGLGTGGNAHYSNEYITVDGLRDYMKYVATFLYEYAAT